MDPTRAKTLEEAQVVQNITADRNDAPTMAVPDRHCTSPECPETNMETFENIPDAHGICGKDLNRTIVENIQEAQILFNNAKFYYCAGEFHGALVSFSCCAVSLKWLIAVFTVESDKTTDSEQKACFMRWIESAAKIQSCCFHSIEGLKGKVKGQSSSNSGADEDKLKNWESICVKVQPLVFKKGSSDCIFFDDVVGLMREKSIMRSSLIFPLMYPNLYPKASKGILIYGPPGTGKTFIVKAAVNELQKEDPKIGVLYFAPSPGDLKGKYVGETEKKIEELFTCASKKACEHQTDCRGKKFISVIFMDEMDAIAPDRSNDTTGLAANSVNTLLQMMDGIKSAPNVAVVAATNYPWNLDAAILRRFDTQLLIDLPDTTDMQRLLDLSVRKAINLDVDNSDDRFCKDPYFNKKEEDIKPQCDLECERRTSPELYLQKPYNKVRIDYYEERELFREICARLKADNFSNSDVNRLMKTALTYSGKLAVKNGLFYSTKLLNDYQHDKYISSLTTLRDTDESIRRSIEIVARTYKGEPLDEHYYQIHKPAIPWVVHEKYVYVNAKCLLHKNSSFLLDHPDVEDYFIRTTTMEKLKATNVKEIADVLQPNAFSLAEYATNVLGVKRTGKNAYTTSSDGEIHYIISMKMLVKHVSKDSSSKDFLFPPPKPILSGVFRPIATFFEGKKREYETREDIMAGKDSKKPESKRPTQSDLMSSFLKRNWFLVSDGLVTFTESARAMLHHHSVATVSVPEPAVRKDALESIARAVNAQFKSNREHSYELANMCILFSLMNRHIIGDDAKDRTWVRFARQCETHLPFYKKLTVIDSNVGELQDGEEYQLKPMYGDVKALYNPHEKCYLLTVDQYLTHVDETRRQVYTNCLRNSYSESFVNEMETLRLFQASEKLYLIRIPEDTYGILFPGDAVPTDEAYESDHQEGLSFRLAQLVIDDITRTYEIEASVSGADACVDAFEKDLRSCVETLVNTDNIVTHLEHTLSRIARFQINMQKMKIEDGHRFMEDASRMADDAPAEVLGIVEKKVLIKSSVSLENLSVIRKQGGIVNFLGDVMRGTADGLIGMLKAMSGTATTKTEQAKLDKQKTMKQIADVTEKGLLLPLLFKQIDAIGYMAEKSTDVITPDARIQSPEVRWLNNRLNWSEHTVHGLFSLLTAISHFVTGTFNEKGLSKKSRLGRLVVNAGSIVALVFVLLTVFSTLGLATGVVVGSLIGLVHLYRWWTSHSKTPADILRNKETLVIFNILKDGVLETDKLDQSMGDLFIESIVRASKSDWQLLRVCAGVLSVFLGAEDVEPYKLFTHPRRLTAPLGYTRPTNDPLHDQMKQKLANLNMPIESFYYALTLVKSTYVKKMGEDVKKYHADKDAFLLEYAKRKK